MSWWSKPPPLPGRTLPLTEAEVRLEAFRLVVRHSTAGEWAAILDNAERAADIVCPLKGPLKDEGEAA